LFIVRRAYIPSQSRTDIVNRHHIPFTTKDRLPTTKLESDISFMVSKEDELARAIQTFTLFVALLELRNATFDSVRFEPKQQKAYTCTTTNLILDCLVMWDAFQVTHNHLPSPPLTQFIIHTSVIGF
jgi:hypothetical protein